MALQGEKGQPRLEQRPNALHPQDRKQLVLAALAIGALAVLRPNAGLAGGVSVVDGLTREAALTPGAKGEGRIIIRNDDEKARPIRVYQTDYLFYADGRNLYGDPGTAVRSNAKWITFTPQQLVVAPRDTAAIDYVIQVPKDDTLVGTYWSMLMVEPLSTDALAPLPAEKDKAQVGLRTVLRYGIQLVTHIGNSGTRDLRFHNQRLVTVDGKHKLQVDLENVGERWLTPVLWVELQDAQGAAAGHFDGPKTRLYPGCSARFEVDLGSLASGKYNALIVADNQDDDVFGTKCKLEIH